MIMSGELRAQYRAGIGQKNDSDEMDGREDDTDEQALDNTVSSQP